MESSTLLHAKTPTQVERVDIERSESTTNVHASLESLIRLIERVAPGMRGSVLLLDEDGMTLHHGAAPNLPDAYTRLIDGERIGPVAGSCGTAAYRRERVIVRDIATDPLWANYRAAALPFGLAACWSTPIIDSDGRVLGTFAMYYDEPREPTPADLDLAGTAAGLALNIITGARAMNALRSSQQRLRAALDASSTSTFRWDMRTNAVESDEGLYKLFGVDPATASGSFELFVSLIHPEDRDRVIAAALRCAEQGVDLDEEFRIVRPDGSMRWAVDKGKTVFSEDGKPRYLIGACVDITERRNELREAELARDLALAEAKAERARLYEVFMQAPAAIAVVEGSNHIFTVTNSLYIELVARSDLIGKSVRETFPELADQGLLELLGRVSASGETYSAFEREVRLDRDGDGVAEVYFVDFVYQPLKTASGATFGILIVATDVTTRVRARHEIIAARAEAERANKAKSEFLAAMSHDLRTPLNAIGGFAELAAEGMYGPVSPGLGDALARIRRAGSHLLTLINDILSFAKIEAGRVQLQIADLSVNETLAAASPMIELQAQRKGLSFEVHRGPDDVRVRADRERTIQILTNLFTNSVKFTAAGSITVDWSADDTNVVIDVTDTGRGIPADKLASIFEPFVQVGRSDEEQQQGVGLGLATSRELAKAMAGDLTVTSGVGRGSTFTLRLPRGVESLADKVLQP
jgi:PAS domain S-box-containing protein